MKFEVNHFYKHTNGRCIAVVGEVQTYKWGRMLVVEETDPTGHGISCIDENSEDIHDRWVEIGKDEWMKEFKHVQAVH